MGKEIDCVVCGSCTADILVKPFTLDEPMGAGRLHRVDPIDVTTGGLSSNSGIAMSKLGLSVAMLSYTGDDVWSTVMREKYKSAGIDTSRLLVHPDLPSSSTIVFTDESGERSFAHYQGAPRVISSQTILDNLDLIAKSRYFLIGYYSLLPSIEDDLADVFLEIRKLGCKTAMDAAGDGGNMQPLDRILPHLDIYVPSHGEAEHQTGESDPEKIITTYRDCGAKGLLGVKLGQRGALIQTADRKFFQIDAVGTPGPVVDTTGAGDSFYAGLITGLVRGLDVPTSARLAAAAGACCVTGHGASTAIKDYEKTLELALAST